MRQAGDVDFSEVLNIVGGVADRFTRAGFRLYLVGGVVRDLVLGAHNALDDIDLTTDARPPDIQRLLKPESSSLWTQGERFGTIGAKVGGRDIEVTTHRADTYDPGSRKPTVVFGDDLLVDLSRRDFSINAMAYSVSDKELFDPFDGMTDLAERRLRTPENPEVSFVDDPLRMLRAARFIPRFGLDVDPGLEAAVGRLGDRMAIVSAERIHDELERLLAVSEPFLGMDFLHRTGLINQIVPGLKDGTLFGVRASSEPGSVLTRRAGLIAPLGVEGAGRWLRDLRYSTKDRNQTLALLRGVNMLAQTSYTASDLRRLIQLVGINSVASTIELCRNLDVSGSALAPSGVEVDEIEKRIADMARVEDLSNLEPPVSGGDLIRELGLEPGPRVGDVLDMLSEHRLDFGPFTAAEAIAQARRWLADYPA